MAFLRTSKKLRHKLNYLKVEIKTEVTVKIGNTR